MDGTNAEETQSSFIMFSSPLIELAAGSGGSFKVKIFANLENSVKKGKSAPPKT